MPKKVNNLRFTPLEAFPEVLNTSDLCAYLNISPTYIYTLVKKGEIPHFYLDDANQKGLRFSRDDIKTWLDERRQWA